MATPVNIIVEVAISLERGILMKTKHKSKKSVAIFVDWDNIRKGIFGASVAIVSKKISYNNIDNVVRFITSFIDQPNEDIYRIFMYFCEPYGGIANGVDYKLTKVYRYSTKFIKRLQVRDYIAVRKGNIAYRGLDIKKGPVFEQKQVDMLLGLDIAHISYNHLADRVLILSNDLDMIPAMKVARINGLQVICGCCPDVQLLSNQFKKHSDFIRNMDFTTIFQL